MVNISSMFKTDTHYYDGKYLKYKEKYSTSLKEGKNATPDDKIDAYAALYEMITNSEFECKITALKGLRLIGCNIGQLSNYDTTNQIYADNLLYLVIKKLCELQCDEQESGLYIIALQLSDIVTSGPCAQGRTTRLWQVFTMLYEEDPTI